MQEWDPIFENADCQFSRMQNKYKNEDEYCGWNMLKNDHLCQLRESEVQTAEAEVDEDLRLQEVEAASAVLDVAMEAAGACACE